MPPLKFTTLAKTYLNRCLKPMNLRLETLTQENQERKRLKTLKETGYFTKPVFPLPPGFSRMETGFILEALSCYERRFADFENASHNEVGYSFDNQYFSSPDAEVLYTLIRMVRPERVVEIGSGNSTKIIRQALLDGKIDAHVIAIDPHPKEEISSLADQLYRRPVETLAPVDWFESLQAGDILFIDSSHEVKTGNDVTFLYLNLIPSLPAGVLTHIHDIFLPYDYPEAWVVERRWGWNEQYLVQSLLAYGASFEVLWASYFLQRTQADFPDYFPHLNGRVGGSLWLRKN